MSTGVPRCCVPCRGPYLWPAVNSHSTSLALLVLKCTQPLSDSVLFYLVGMLFLNAQASPPRANPEAGLSSRKDARGLSRTPGSSPHVPLVPQFSCRHWGPPSQQCGGRHPCPKPVCPTRGRAVRMGPGEQTPSGGRRRTFLDKRRQSRSCTDAAPADSGCGSRHMPGLVGTGGLSRADSLALRAASPGCRWPVRGGDQPRAGGD